MNTLTAMDFETRYDDTHTFPFFEDENGELVTGYGHIDKAEFARLVNAYDRLADADSQYTPDDVKHGHATITFATDLAAAQGYPEWHFTFAKGSGRSWKSLWLRPTATPITWVTR